MAVPPVFDETIEALQPKVTARSVIEQFPGVFRRAAAFHIKGILVPGVPGFVSTAAVPVSPYPQHRQYREAVLFSAIQDLIPGLEYGGIDPGSRMMNSIWFGASWEPQWPFS
jgi:hypothetical protein